MSRPRFSLRWLLGSVSFLAIGCGLLIYARPVTACLTFAATLLVLFAAIPLSVYRSGERRAFWFGFALFGLGYLGLVCGPWQAPDVHIQIGVRERLPTTKLLELAYEWVPTKPSNAPAGSGGSGGGGMFGDFDQDGDVDLVVSNNAKWSDVAAALKDEAGDVNVVIRHDDGVVGGEMFAQMGMGGMGRGGPRPTAGVPITEWNDFVIVGHSLWAIGIAISGGIIARWCQRTGCRAPDA